MLAACIDSDQTVLMQRLIQVYTGGICHKIFFIQSRSYMNIIHILKLAVL